MLEKIAKQIVWLGHDGFRIDSDKIIYIDPFQITTGPKADIILISHEHFDHCSPDDVAKIQKPETVIVTEKLSAQKLSGDIRVVAPNETIEIDGVHIETVPAYNTDKDFHPQSNGWLGFIVEIAGVRIYHTGDADFIPEMKQIKIDIALLPVSGTYVMTAQQAVEAALALNPKLAIPMHYGSIVGSEEDAVSFKNALQGKIEVKILQKS
ncbi:MAG: MBL fold metallo-hydrolase [SAR324 cluster bacterium]|nr:MBL fold metallo-hydrolase [SAR324 cluster bacterium]